VGGNGVVQRTNQVAKLGDRRLGHMQVYERVG
jgi:hypothetical protein